MDDTYFHIVVPVVVVVVAAAAAAARSSCIVGSPVAAIAVVALFLSVADAVASPYYSYIDHHHNQVEVDHQNFVHEVGVVA